MEQTKRLYESTFIVNAGLEDTQIDSVIARVQELITSSGGEVAALNKWGRKRLAYTISKKNNGFYVNIEFKSPPLIVTQLERLYQLEENIIRHLTVQVDEKALKARLAPIPQVDTVASPPPLPPSVTHKEPLFDDKNEGDESR